MSKNQNYFSDFFKSFSDMSNFNSFDWDKAIAESRRNVQVFSDASKSAAEGAEAIIRRKAQVAQKYAEDMSKLLKDSVSSAKSPEKIITQNADFTKSTIESAIADSREIFEMASKSTSETFDVINSRISESLVEWTNWADETANKATSSASAKSSSSKKAA